MQSHIWVWLNASAHLSIYQNLQSSIYLLMPLLIYLSTNDYTVNLFIYQCLYWSIYLSFYSFLFQYLYQSIYLSETLVIYLSNNASTDLYSSISAFTDLSIYFSFIGLSKLCLFLIDQRLYWTIFSSIPLLNYLFINTFTDLSIYQALYLSIYLCTFTESGCTSFIL